MINIIICSRCKSNNVIKIVDGIPSYDLVEASQRNEIILGGCCITDNDPYYGCLYCNYRRSLKLLDLNNITKLRIWIGESRPCISEER